MPVSAQKLLKEKRFLPLFLTQFFGAFNDNAFKLAMLTLISYFLTKTQAQSEHYQALAGALFTIPFFLLSATAGQLADKYDKAKIVRLIKLLEIVLMIIGSFALYQGNVFLMLVVLTGMGVHSTFFGPIKYALLPEHLPRNQLLTATGLIEASTFVAILLGTTFGTLAVSGPKSQVLYAIIITNTVALLGFASSCYIPKAKEIKSDLKLDFNIIRATKNIVADVIQNPLLFPAILAISWFWLIGAVILIKLPDYTHFVLGADSHVFALFLALFSIGIACGSLMISRFLAGRITLRYVPITLLLLSFFALDLALASENIVRQPELLGLKPFFTKFTHWRISIDFFIFSFCSGLYIVPLYTYLQVMSNEGERARVIAANNIINSLFMVLGSLLVMFCLYLNFSIQSIFFIIAFLNFLVAVMMVCLLIFQAKKYNQSANQSLTGKKSL